MPLSWKPPLVLFLASFAVPVSGMPETLTLDSALSRARDRAPSVISARSRIEEARARLQGASRRLRDNPEVDAAAGSQVSGENHDTRVDITLLQNLQVGGRRSARIRLAQAELSRAIAESENRLREALRDTATTFFRALHARDRSELAARVARISEEILDSARRRYEAGDVALLDVNLARTAAARARTEVLSARAAEAAAIRELRTLLGLPEEEPLTLSGELRIARRHDLAELLASVPERPDLRAIRSEVEAAEAEIEAARASGWPELGVGARYEREEGQDFVLGAVRLTLPLFDRGKAERAEAEVRASRLRVELQYAVSAARSQVRAAFEAHRLQAEAVRELEREAIPLLEENEALSRESYQAGQISLAEVLVTRREIVEARVDYLARLLDAAIAAAELEASAGVER